MSSKRLEMKGREKERERERDRDRQRRRRERISDHEGEIRRNENGKVR